MKSLPEMMLAGTSITRNSTTDCTVCTGWASLTQCVIDRILRLFHVKFGWFWTRSVGTYLSCDSAESKNTHFECSRHGFRTKSPFHSPKSGYSQNCKPASASLCYQVFTTRGKWGPELTNHVAGDNDSAKGQRFYLHHLNIRHTESDWVGHKHKHSCKIT